ncbi:MAG: hypothetical protein WD021_09355 [Rhodothermales bacterium]
MNKKHKTSERVLGIAATPRAVHAVLLEGGPNGPEVVRRFVRTRTIAPTGYEDVAPHHDEPSTDQSIDGGDDFTIEFGDGPSSNANLFLGSEFGVSDDAGEAATAPAIAQPFDFELGDILSEVEEAGYDDVVLAFTLSATEAPFFEIAVPPGKSGRHDRDDLLERLATEYSSPFDADRVVFLPMNRVDEGEGRYLALFPKPTDPVSVTLTELRKTRDVLPHASLLDAELSVLMGLSVAARDVYDFRSRPVAAADESVTLFDHGGNEEVVDAKVSASSRTLVVRAGAEDTLVAFLSGRTVHHAEILRSLTAFDQAETICSRVLLQQDEHGEGEVDHILLLSEEREKELAESFGVFFPDAEVDLLRDYLPEVDDEVDDGATAIVSACGVALRVLKGSPFADSFEDINFLPKRLLRRKIQLPVSLHMIAMSVAIVATVLFFMARYSTAESEMATYRDRLEEVAPEEVDQDIGVLQAQIDSMQHLYATYTRAIEVLDTLLIGSDRWSRVLENTSMEASRLSGFWIESLEPGVGHIQLAGNATSRDNVVVFASRVDGIIESLSFSEIREWPVYSYSMSIPVGDSLPRAAQYLRESVRLDDHPVVDEDDRYSTTLNDGTER